MKDVGKTGKKMACGHRESDYYPHSTGRDGEHGPFFIKYYCHKCGSSVKRPWDGVI